MRHRKATATTGQVHRRVPFSQELMFLLVIGAVGVWMVASLGQEVYVGQQLSHQAGELRQHNAALEAANDGYRRDIAAVSSGAAAEEEARLNGYSRADEKLYLVSAPRRPPPRRTPR